MGSYGLGQRTQGDVMGLIFGQPISEEEQLDGSHPKRCKRGSLCLFPLTGCACSPKTRVPGTENGTKFLRKSSAKIIPERKRERDRRLEKRTVCGGACLAGVF
ncbi:hypothetical protein IGI04_037640 [Brassica rapa subsp. trilocularis]|uniref:Uncharacterized protein n=1 Tax=Brassica rapa subsp. trilocularis TaxID=1813537 RepID=A0ABQ7LKN3_BRACM|nr:hypothetical protein IGI04_037640 [Brassica rapa subsp. trilocularis]